MNSVLIEGGCICGAVHYRIDQAPSVALNCHCTDCRKGSGAPFVTWAIFPRDALTWPTRKPACHTIGAKLRFFCPQCGTLLGCQPGACADIIAVSVCTMENPETVAPAYDAWTQDKLPWVRLADGLPRYAAGAAAEPVTAWNLSEKPR